jgi:hypothetical protein
VLAEARTAAALALQLEDSEQIKLAGAAWRAKAQHFLSKDADRQKDTHQVFRKKTYEFVLCLNNILESSTGRTLDFWRLPADPALRPHPAQWPTLVLNADQGTDGFAATWFLRSQNVCFLFARDESHRSWNNAKLALQGSGLWGYVLLTIAMMSGDHGPFDEARFFQTAKESCQVYMQTSRPGDDPIFCSLRSHLVKDLDLQDQLADPGLDDQLWAAIPEATQPEEQRANVLLLSHVVWQRGRFETGCA